MVQLNFLFMVYFTQAACLFSILFVPLGEVLLSSQSAFLQLTIGELCVMLGLLCETDPSLTSHACTSPDHLL